MPKISVIVPVYNTEKYLPKCLNSLVGQTLKDIEIICINDCSTDDSLQILQKYAADDNRIKIIEFPENKGAAVARNKGIDEAKGEYIGFVDSDDFVDLNFYEKLYNKALETGADVVKGNVYSYNEKEDLFGLSTEYDINTKIQRNKAYFLYAFTSAIYKRSFIQEYNIRFPMNFAYFEDPYFSILAAFYYNQVELCDDARYFYTQHENSACNQTDAISKQHAMIKISQLILEKLNESSVSREHYEIVIEWLFDSLYTFWFANFVCDEELCRETEEALHFLIAHSRYKIDIFAKINLVMTLHRQSIEIIKCYHEIQNNAIQHIRASSGEPIYFVSVVTDFDMYNKYVKENPIIKSMQNVQFVMYDNTQEDMPVTRRYNSFLNKYDYSNAAWFVFCHPDWEILQDLNVIFSKLDKNKIYGPIGCVGEFVNNKYFTRNVGKCIELSRNEQNARITKGIYDNVQFERADTLDCQAIVFHSTLVDKYDLRFDENLEWDLYAEDFSMNAKIKFGIDTYAFTMDCCHHSSAGFKPLPMSYHRSKMYVDKKYPKEVFAGCCSTLGGKEYKQPNEKEIVMYKLRKKMGQGCA